ncbi:MULTISPECIES: LysR family transcriptional regulator [unclassified Beijerinckia]|uniref:LysR family transcriptional regulator n=1 Tax=unclassified Beijerinckia TaxID=2638183 RepID=UPI00089C049D|nr:MULTISPECIES: LysR family transcriptional regulator [unclassified Beijerinckia]MDH7794470.1 DNA-binding transcriptional LysR family regulator [Beijerinckia sp. GAS462]SEB63395.1 transcriptional regulator, LysR family [Beijerinckia sp. 28-YEA-48]
MSTDFESLRSFAVVAELGSFHDAAQTLNISAPALTRRIQNLEKSLGIELLERTTRNVQVTIPGREFLPKVHRLLDDFDASLASIKNLSAQRTGRLVIACIPTVAHYFLPRVIAQFNAHFHQVRIRIVDENANAVIHRVKRQNADLGITFLGGRDSDLEYINLIEDPYVLACRHDHPLASSKRIAWRDLAPYRFVTANRLSGNRLVIDRALQNAGWHPNWFYEVQHLPTSLGLVEAGLAVAALPRLAFPTEPPPTLTSRPLIKPQVHRTISVIRHRGASLSRVAEAFLDILRETVKQKDFVG